jgi:nitrite reductase/ring-hydroxylating ferredoxin subunit
MATMTARVMPIPDGLVDEGSADAPFVAVGSVDDLAPGQLRRFTRGDLDLLVAHTERGICVVADRCPHMAAPLSLGALDGCVVACPLHKGRFDLATSDVVQFPTTGGLDPDGNYHAPWSPPDAQAKSEPTDLKAQARAATRVRRLRYFPVRLNGSTIEVRVPG